MPSEIDQLQAALESFANRMNATAVKYQTLDHPTYVVNRPGPCYLSIHSPEQGQISFCSGDEGNLIGYIVKEPIPEPPAEDGLPNIIDELKRLGR